MKKKIAYFLLTSSTLISCSYNFSPDNFIDLKQPSKNSQIIKLVNFMNMDTINVQRLMEYNFIGLQNQNTINSDVYVDDSLISSSWEGRSGTFSLKPENYDDGVHQIRIEHTFSSGSGSIAEQAGLENFKESSTFQFFVNREPSPPPILKAEIINGTIFVKWSTDYEMDYINANLSIKFKNSEIKIPLTNEILASGIYNDTSTVLHEGNSNTPNFDNYSSVTYAIIFENEFKNKYGSPKSISYKPSQLKTEIIFVDFDSFKFKWSAHPLYANFETFEFSYAGQKFTGSSSGGDYLITSPYIFGKEYTLNVRPSETQLPLPLYSYRNVSFKNETSNVFDINSLFVREIIYSPTTNHFYALIIEDRSGSEYDFSIYEFSYEMEFLRKSNRITYDNVRYEYLDITLNPTDNSIYIDARGSAYKMDIGTLQILQEYKDPPLTSELKYRGDILVRFDYSNNLVTVTNVTTNKVLYSGTSPSSKLSYLSPSGDYILIYSDTGNFLYKIQDDQLVQAFDFSTISLNGNVEVFENNLFYSTTNEIVIFDLSTNTSKSFDFGTTQKSIQFDSFSKRLLVSQSGQEAIYNILTNQIIRFESNEYKQAIGIFNQQDRYYFMRLWNGKLIHSKGIYINLD